MSRGLYDIPKVMCGWGGGGEWKNRGTHKVSRVRGFVKHPKVPQGLGLGLGLGRTGG